MPVWKPYTSEHPYTMVIDVESVLGEDYRKEAREFLQSKMN